MASYLAGASLIDAEVILTGSYPLGDKIFFKESNYISQEEVGWRLTVGI